jgi:hypothetical protein
MKSSELMKMAEDGEIEIGRVVVDQDDNEFIFCGKMFQYLGYVKENMVYGLCVDDDWKLTNRYVELE